MAFVVHEQDGVAGGITSVPLQRSRDLPEPGGVPTPAPSWLRRSRTPALVAVDATAGVLACVALGISWSATATFVVLCLLALSGAGLYRTRLALSVLDDVPSALAATFISASVASLVEFQVVGSLDTAFVVAAPVFAMLLLLGRCASYAVVRVARRSRRVARRALVVGGGVVASELITALFDHPEYGVLPVGFLADEPYLESSQWLLPHVGGRDELARSIAELDVRTVIVAFGSGPESVMVDVLRTCDRLDCEFFYVPRLYELSSVSRNMDNIWGIPVCRLPRAPFRSVPWRLKRGLDVVLSAVALVALAPVLLLCALLVRYELGSPVLFRQERVGVGDVPFRLYKFCSMRPVAGCEGVWSIADDARLGSVGRFLRRTSLDELPQLWNVLRGDMSLVGPRPERPVFAAQFSQEFPCYRARHRVPVGLTGWSQVNGLRGDTSISHRARFDNYYIANWSLWEDMKIMLRTVVHLARVPGR